MNTKRFYRTVITIEVLSEEPVEAMDVDDIAYEIREGSYSGEVEFGPSEVVDGPTMARLLMKQGSDPEFFGLDDEGNPVESETV